MQSTTSIGYGAASNYGGADKQEFLNAGLSTSHAMGKKSINQTNQVSIMKTIQSSVMRGGGHNNPNITQSVINNSHYHPINSVIS